MKPVLMVVQNQSLSMHADGEPSADTTSGATVDLPAPGGPDTTRTELVELRAVPSATSSPYGSAVSGAVGLSAGGRAADRGGRGSGGAADAEGVAGWVEEHDPDLAGLELGLRAAEPAHPVDQGLGIGGAPVAVERLAVGRKSGL